MKKRQVTTGMAAALLSAMLFPPGAVAGSVTITNGYCDVIAVGTAYSESGSSKESKTFVRKGETRKDMSPLSGRISRILVVNVSDGANPDKATLLLRDCANSGVATDFTVVVNADGSVSVTEQNKFGGL